MAQVGSISRNQNGEIRKGDWQQVTFKSAEWDSAQMGKKAKGELPNGEIEKSIPQHIPK